jgi:peroxiredoxin
MSLRLVGLLAVAAAIFAAGYFSFFDAPAAPQVQFNTLTGESISTNDLRGKVVLVEFWATSCVTCVEEMPKLVQTYNKYRQQGFEIIAVAMDYDPPNHVLNFAQKNALPFKVALDIKGEIARGFGDIRLTPTSFLIDKRGRIVKQYLGAPRVQEFHSLLEKKLKESA